MLEGHVLREVLAPQFRQTTAFTLHELFHGITAPGFLFGAGFTFAIATQRKWDQLLLWNRAFWRRIWRMIVLIAIGYALHLPFLSLQKTLSSPTQLQWQQLWGFDALQCIALTLLLLRLVFVLLKNERLFLAAAAIGLLASVYLAPFAWQPHWNDSLPLALSGALNGLSGSIFPLFPYAGFVFAGVLVSWIFLRATQNETDDILMKRFALIGAVLMAVGFFLETIPFSVYPPYNFWLVSPNYFWTKLGFLLLLLAALWFFEETLLVQRKPHIFMPRWLTTLGVESLFVYILHLIVLYGWVVNARLSLRAFWSGSLGVVESLLLFFFLALVCALSALLWRYFKKHHPVLMRGMYWWMGISVTFSFLMNPY